MGRLLSRQEMIDGMILSYYNIPVRRKTWTTLHEMGYVRQSWEDAVLESCPQLRTDEAFNKFYGRASCR